MKMRCARNPRLACSSSPTAWEATKAARVASALAIEAIHDLVRRTAGDADVTWPYQIDPQRTVTENELMVATRLAADRIAAQRIGVLRDMGSTVVALRLSEEGAVIAHVGDSRLYRLRGGVLAQLTIDHSLAAQLAASGITPDADFAWRHVVTRALGTSTSEPEVQRRAVARGDVFLLCSDGLSEVLAPDAIAAQLAAPAEAACRELVDAAYRAGSRDRDGTGQPRPRRRCRRATLRFTRTSIARSRSPPSGRTTRSSSTRSRRACTVGEIRPNSSRNRVPPSARTNMPSRRWVAPVYAPGTWPNSSLVEHGLGDARRSPR